MAEYGLGTARGRIVIDASGAMAGYAAAGAAHKTYMGRLAAAAPAIRRVGTVMLGIGVAAAAGIGIAVKASADFEQSLSGFRAASQATEAEMDKIRATALRIGRDTAFGAGQAIDAMVALSKNGIKTADIINGAADAVVALAAAGEIELSSAANIMAAAMNIFNIAGKDASKVADLLAGTANNSAADVTSLGEALQNVGPSASLLGLEIGDVTTALALLAEAGITGGKAGTTLNRMLLQLANQTPAAEKAMRELGLITKDGANQFFDAEGNMKSLGEVSGLLADSMKGLTKEQKIAYMETIFGSRALAAATALAEAGAEGFDELKDAISEVSAADVAEEKLNNLSGSLTILKGTIETALIGVGTPLQSMLKGIVDGLTTLINKFAQMPPSFQKFIAVAGLVTAVVGILGGGFMILISMLPALAGGFKLLMTTVLPVVAPIFAVVAAVAALAAGLVYAYKNSETFRNIVKRAFDGVKNFIQTVRDTWDKFVQGFRNGSSSIGQGVNKVLGPIQTFGGIVRKIADTVREVFLAAVDKVGEVIGRIRGFIDNLVQGWQNGSSQIGQGVNKILGPVQQLGGIFRQVADGIRKGIGAAMDWLRETFEMFRPQVEGAMKSVGGMVSRFGELLSALKPVANVVGVVLAGAFKLLVSAIQVLWNVAQPIISFLATLIGDVLRMAINGVVQVFQGAVQIISGILDVFIGLFTGNWSRMWEGIKGIAVGIWNAIVGLVKVWLSVGVLGAVRNIFTGIIAFFKGSWSTIRGIFSGALNGIRTTISNVFNAIRNVITNVINAVRNFITNAWNAIRTRVTTSVNNIRTTISNVFQAIRATISTILAAIRQNISTVWNGIRALIQTVMAAIRSVITSIWNGIRSTITGVVNGIRSTVSSVFNAIRSLMTSAANGARSAVTSAFNAMRSAVSNAITGLLNTVKGIPKRILNALGNLGNLLRDAGRQIIQGLIGGITSMAGKVKDAVGNVLKSARNLLPFSPAKEGPFSGKGWTLYAGRSIIDALTQGIKDEERKAVLATQRVAKALSGALGDTLADPALTSLTVHPAAPEPDHRRLGSQPPPPAAPMINEYNFGDLTLPNVTDGESFLDGLEQAVRARSR